MLTRYRVELAFAAIAILLCTVYVPTFSFPLTQWDDTLYLTDNPFVTGQNLDWSAFFRARPLGEFVPLTTLFNRLIFQLGDGHLLWFRATSLILHFIVVLLLYPLLRRVSSETMLILLGLAIFALHPIQTETIVWLAARKDLLAACFGLIALLSYLRAVDGRGKWLGWMGLGIIVQLAAIASKPIWVVLPGWILLDGIVNVRPAERRKRASLVLAGSLLVSLGLLASVFTIARMSGNISAVPNSTGAERIWATVGILGRIYVLNLFLPDRLLPMYGESFRGPLFSIGHAIALSAFAALSLTLARSKSEHRRLLMWVGGCSLIAFLPYMNWFETAISAADHYFYISTLVFSISVALLLFRLKAISSSIAIAVMAMLVLLWAYESFNAAQKWRNPLNLWAATLARYPSMIAPQLLTAMAEEGRGKTSDALHRYEGILRQDSANVPARFNLGALLLRVGEPESAESHFRQLTKIQPMNGNVFYMLGKSLLRQEKWDEAKIEIVKALVLEPKNAIYLYDLGWVEAKRKKYDEAKLAWEKVLEVEPGHAAAMRNLEVLDQKFRNLPPQRPMVR